MAMLDQVPSSPARYGIERAMLHARQRINAGSYTSPQPDPRARHKVPVRRRRSKRNCVSDTCEPPVTSMQ